MSTIETGTGTPMSLYDMQSLRDPPDTDGGRGQACLSMYCPRQQQVEVMLVQRRNVGKVMTMRSVTKHGELPARIDLIGNYAGDSITARRRLANELSMYGIHMCNRTISRVSSFEKYEAVMLTLKQCFKKVFSPYGETTIR